MLYYILLKYFELKFLKIFMKTFQIMQNQSQPFAMNSTMLLTYMLNKRMEKFVIEVIDKR